MNDFLSVLIFLVLALLWMGGIMAFIAWMMEEFGPTAPLWFKAASLLFYVAVPIAAFITWAGRDPDPTRLCLRGHQVWVLVSNGKTSTTQKRWMCDEREP